MIIAIVIILVISNILSWGVIMRLISEVKQQDSILEGLGDTFKEMSKCNESKVKKCFTTSHNKSIISSKGGGIICRQKR